MLISSNKSTRYPNPPLPSLKTFARRVLRRQDGRFHSLRVLFPTNGPQNALCGDFRPVFCSGDRSISGFGVFAFAKARIVTLDVFS